MKPSKILIELLKSNIKRVPRTTTLRSGRPTMSSPGKSSPGKSSFKSTSSPKSSKLNTIDELGRSEDEIADSKMGDLSRDIDKEAAEIRAAHDAAVSLRDALSGEWWC